MIIYIILSTFITYGDSYGSEVVYASVDKIKAKNKLKEFHSNDNTHDFELKEIELDKD